MAVFAWVLAGCGATSGVVERPSEPAAARPAASAEDAPSEDAAPRWLELASIVSTALPGPHHVRAHQGTTGTAVLLMPGERARVAGPAAPDDSSAAVAMIRDRAVVWTRPIAVGDVLYAMAGRVLVTERGVVYAALTTVLPHFDTGSDPRGAGVLLVALDAATGAEIARARFDTVDRASFVSATDLVVGADGDLVVGLELVGEMWLSSERSQRVAGGHQSVVVVRLSPDLGTVRSSTLLRFAASAHLDALEDGGVDVFVLLGGRFVMRAGRHTVRAAPEHWARLVAARLDPRGDVLEVASIVLPENGAEVGAPIASGEARVLALQPSVSEGQPQPAPCLIQAPSARLADLQIECDAAPGVHVPSSDGSRGWVMRRDGPVPRVLERTTAVVLQRLPEAGSNTPAPSTFDVQGSREVLPITVLDSDDAPSLLLLTRAVPPRAGMPSFVALVPLSPPGARADLPAFSASP